MEEEVIQVLKSHALQDIYRRYHVSRVSLFGSYARGEADHSSDVDLLIEQDVGLGLEDYFRFREEMEHSLNRKVDIVNKERLNPILEKYIKKDMTVIH